MTRLCFGGPVAGVNLDPQALAQAHIERGYRAAYCPDLRIDAVDEIHAVRTAFAAAKVTIAEVGAWCNMLEPDAAKRTQNLKYVAERLALADEVGALCCVNIAGSYNSEHWDGPHPNNLSAPAFEAIVENVRMILDQVQPKRAKFALEMMPWAFPDSADSFIQLMRAVDRPMFAVHLDPVNIISSPRLYFNNANLLHECFTKLGQWIVSCHAKDITLGTQLTVHLNEVRPGLGGLDYQVYLTELALLPHEVPLMLEHLPTEAEYDAARQFLFNQASELGFDY